MMNEIKKNADKRMDKSVVSLSLAFKKLRTGRAHTGLLEHLTAEYYGAEVPLTQVANVAVEDSRTLTVTPWERQMIPVIEKAIMNSDLGLTPATAGNVIRVPVPMLTEERRRGNLLHDALAFGHIKIARWLVKKGLDLRDAKAHYVWAAMLSRDEKVIRFAVENGAPIDGPGKRTALHHECNHGWTKLVPCLLELGANPKAKDEMGNTPLHLAAQRGNASSLVRLLLAAGANPKAKNKKGETAGAIARKAKTKAVANLLKGS